MMAGSAMDCQKNANPLVVGRLAIHGWSIHGLSLFLLFLSAAFPYQIMPP
jgi:hypothetical protein